MVVVSVVECFVENSDCVCVAVAIGELVGCSLAMEVEGPFDELLPKADPAVDDEGGSEILIGADAETVGNILVDVSAENV